jgi:hypothetical protein
MKSEDGTIVHSVLWLTVIYFNMKTKASESQPEETKDLFRKFLVNLEQTDFASRVSYFSKQNKSVNKI